MKHLATILDQIGLPMVFMFLAGMAIERGLYFWFGFFLVLSLLFVGTTIIAVLEYDNRKHRIGK